MVGPDLTVPGHPEIFVIGDTAHAAGRDGAPLPGLAPVAKQQGAYVARVLRARLAGRPAPKPFRYRNWGTMATIGRGAAVADFGWLRLHGTLAWLLWGLIHISFLIGFRNRFIVLLRLAVVLRDLPVRRATDHGPRFALGSARRPGRLPSTANNQAHATGVAAGAAKRPQHKAVRRPRPGTPSPIDFGYDRRCHRSGRIRSARCVAETSASACRGASWGW